MIGDRELDHCKPVDRGGDRRGAMRRIPGRDEANGGEIERRANLARKLEMPAVNGIEGTAENAQNRAHAHRIVAPVRSGFRSSAARWRFARR